MPKIAITPEIETFIIENAQLYSSRKIAEKCNVSRDSVKRVLRRNNITVPVELRNKWRVQAMTGKTTFSPEEDKILIEKYLEIPVKRLAVILKRSSCGVNSRLRQLNLIIPKELAATRKESGMFRKGKIATNKGKKQIEYMSPEAIEKTKASRFQKEHIPHNAKTDWEEVQRKDSSGNKYWMIKIPENRKLVYKHVWLWENKNGKVPKGYNVVFKNKNTLDARLENLECISKAENMLRNTIHRYPEELKVKIRKLSKLKRIIKKKSNE
ncbi:HNH endonuclease signature motif containing protein [Chryseobacterium arthrosphaerae]|uniref:HNH endonuclease signature motif containing protein n=1 Tax=Chryseobacterium arthrosphaerae TaxID=651561 RepID=A0ABU7R305_9FLAO